MAPPWILGKAMKTCMFSSLLPIWRPSGTLRKPPVGQWSALETPQQRSASLQHCPVVSKSPPEGLQECPKRSPRVSRRSPKVSRTSPRLSRRSAIVSRTSPQSPEGPKDLQKVSRRSPTVSRRLPRATANPLASNQKLSAGKGAGGRGGAFRSAALC